MSCLIKRKKELYSKNNNYICCTVLMSFTILRGHSIIHAEGLFVLLCQSKQNLLFKWVKQAYLS